MNLKFYLLQSGSKKFTEQQVVVEPSVTIGQYDMTERSLNWELGTQNSRP